MKRKSNQCLDQRLLDSAEGWRPTIARYYAHDFCAFARKAIAVLEPSCNLVWSWHYDYLGEILTLVKDGKLTRVIINVPPRTLKSLLTTIIFPVWVWLTKPQYRFMTASYNHDLSTEHSLMRRKLIQSEWFQQHFGEGFRLSDDCNRADHFMNDCGGSMLATSVGGGMGRGCEIAILDDLMSPDQALSNAERTRANNWIPNVLNMRLNNPSEGVIISVSQRLHELDTTGYLLTQQPGVFTHICVQLVAEEDKSWVFPISGRVMIRKCGDVLQPERFTPAVVAQRQLSRLVFAAQDQQRPTPADGNLIKRSEIKYYGGIDPVTGQLDQKMPASFDMKFISVDCAFKDRPCSDFVAIMVIGVKGRKRFVLNVVNQRLDAAATEAEIRRQRQEFEAWTVLVEDTANGPAVISLLKRDIAGVIAITPKGGKFARMHAAAVEWQAGDWYVARNAAWTELFVEEITSFPNAAHDDLADAMTQSAAWLVDYSLPTIRITDAFTGKELY